MTRAERETKRATLAKRFHQEEGMSWAGAFRWAEAALQELDRCEFRDAVLADLAALPTTTER